MDDEKPKRYGPVRGREDTYETEIVFVEETVGDAVHGSDPDQRARAQQLLDTAKSIRVLEKERAPYSENMWVGVAVSAIIGLLYFFLDNQGVYTREAGASLLETIQAIIALLPISYTVYNGLMARRYTAEIRQKIQEVKKEAAALGLSPDQVSFNTTLDALNEMNARRE